MRNKAIGATSAILIAAIILSAGCNSHKKTDYRPQARELYKESVALAKLYIDSIDNAPDSARLHHMMTHYDEKVMKLNYSYPPDTYLHMSESENEVLSRLTAHIVKSYNMRLEKLDSIMPRTDSIVPRTDNVKTPS